MRNAIHQLLPIATIRVFLNRIKINISIQRRLAGILSACLLGVSAHAQLLHHYDFSTDASDSVGTAHGTLEGNATINSGALTTTAVAGGLNSSGVPQNGVLLPNSAVSGITGAFTIETWFVASYGGGYTTLFSFSGNNTANYLLATPARGNSPYASTISVVGGGGGSAEQQASEQYQDDGVIHDMVVTYDGSTLSYYIDGALGSFSGLSPTITDAGLNLSSLSYIGINGGSPWSDNSMNGSTLDFRIYGQALSADQVARMHALGADATNAAITNALSSVSTASIVVDPGTALTTGTANFATEWNTAGNLEGWTGVNATVMASGTMLSGTATSTDSRVQLSNFSSGPDLDLGWNDFLEVRIQVPASYNGPIQIFYGTTSYTVNTSSGGTTTASTTGFSSNRVVTIPTASIPKDGAFHAYRIDMGLVPQWRATLRDLRIDPVDGTGTSGMAFAIDYIRVGDDPSAIVYQPRYTTECPVVGGTTPSGALYGGGATVLSMESKHFRFLWNATVATQSAWTSDMAHGTLRNCEECWQVHAKKLGYLDPSLAWGTTTGTRYKLNVTSWYGGYWAGGDEDASGNTLSRLNITPDGLRVDPPTWVIPHELMHCFQFYNNGIANANKTGYMPGEWYEFHANYGRERWLQHYQNLYPNSSGIDPTHLRCSHLNIGEGREYYLCWPFFLYLDENPDALPDLGEGTVVKLWQQTGSGEYPFATLERLTPTTALKDIVGYYARRGATYNYSSKTAIQAALAGFGEPLDNAATVRWQFTDLVQRSDDSSWWRVPFDMAPAQGAYAIHVLVVSGSGTAGRTVTVNLHGLPDSARGADWRASFIVIADNGSERYSSLWSSGTNSVTLSGTENKLYLSVAGAPATFYYGGADELTYPYRSHPSKERLPYELQVTGATPRQRDNGATIGLVQHSNGGGYKASTATVASTAYIGPNARVLGSAIVSGTARIEDYAVVSESAQVLGNAVVSGHGWVRGNAVVQGNARVRDWALVEGGTVSGNARILEHGNFKGGTATDTATVKGTAGTLTGALTGNAIIDGDYGDFFSGRDIASSIAFGHQPYVGVPDSWLKPLPVGLYVSYDFATAHDSRILDQYGVTDGFTAGSPAWVSADAKRKGFLTFDGASQFVNLDRSVVDLHDFTFTAWVKPLGGAANQAVLWLGATTTKRLCFTPDDGTGHAKFSIINGGTDQTLTASSALTPGMWTHVAVTLDGTNGTLYLNGTATATSAIATRADQLLAPNIATGLQQNYLARSGSNVMPMFRGALDDVQFYAKALAASDIAALQPATTVSTAGTLYVDLRASDASAGAATWVNNGTLGHFTRTGSPTATTVASIPAVSFNGSNQAYISGSNTVADLEGSSDRSIEVWVYNPSVSDEESMVSWAYRGTTRCDMSFNFGSASTYNAATHWGDDTAWGTLPSAGAWHHLAYTYDGNVTAKVYLDGILSTTTTLSGTLSTFATQPINIACQRNNAVSGGVSLSKYFSGYINSVRVHGGVLTPAQIAANYSLGPYGAPGNSAPTLAAISDQTYVQGSSPLSVPLTVGDADTAVASLTLSGSASNTALVPSSNIVFTGTGASRIATITPSPGTSGTLAITITVSDGVSTASRTFNLSIFLTGMDKWRQQYFGTTANRGNAADTADPNNDEVPNLLEYFLNRNPVNANDPSTVPSVAYDGANLVFTYTRSIVAMNELSYAVEWSDTLAAGSWSSNGVTETILSNDGTVQKVKASVAAGSSRKRFLHLKVTRP